MQINASVIKAKLHSGVTRQQIADDLGISIVALQKAMQLIPGLKGLKTVTPALVIVDDLNSTDNAVEQGEDSVSSTGYMPGAEPQEVEEAELIEEDQLNAGWPK